MKMTERRIAIKEGYANDESPKVIATRLNCSVASVKATASQLGITRTQKGASDFRRGFAVPAEMLGHYKKLMANSFSAKESGELLGLAGGIATGGVDSVQATERRAPGRAARNEHPLRAKLTTCGDRVVDCDTIGETPGR